MAEMVYRDMVTGSPGKGGFDTGTLGCSAWSNPGKHLTHRKGKATMNSDIKDIADWARSQGWTVVDDTKGYTRFYAPNGDYVVRYPATPSNSRRRIADLKVALRGAGLQIPPPSKKEQRAQRRKEDQ